MIIVSGEPRTGTSMTMAILKELGLKLVGEKWPTKNPDANPEGTWEVDDVVMDGLRADVSGDVIKLMTPALFRTEARFIDQIIYCIRKPEEVIASQQALAKKQGMKPVAAEDLFRSHANSLYNVFAAVLPTQNVSIMNYNVAMEHPKEIVNMLASFVGVPPTEAAYKVIKTKHYHHRGQHDSRI